MSWKRSMPFRAEGKARDAAGRIFKSKIDGGVWACAIQFLKFGIVGLSNTVIGYFIYVAALAGFRAADIFPGIDIYIAQFIMFLLSVLWSFYWNNKAVFKTGEGEERNLAAALLKTYAAYAFTSLFLSELLLHLWVGILGISEYLSPIINLLITVPLNFIIQKFWAFRGKTDRSKGCGIDD